MSKTSVRKALAELDAEQLRQLVMDLYDGIREARGWLDYFAAPDVDSMVAKFKDRVDKEWVRAMTRRRMATHTPRITVMRRILSEFRAYSPDQECLARFMLYMTVSNIVEGHENLTESYQAYAVKLLHDTFGELHACGLLTLDLAEQLRGKANAIRKDYFGNSFYRNALLRAIDESALQYLQYECPATASPRS